MAMSSGVSISSLRGAVACDGMTETDFREAITHSKIGGLISAWISDCEVLQDFTAPVWTSLQDSFYPAEFRLVSILPSTAT